MIDLFILKRRRTKDTEKSKRRRLDEDIRKIPQRREWQPTPKNSMDRGAWWATAHEVGKSQTGLSD